jgi:colanic acid/amylovoran biosynthesis protein
VAQVFGPSPDQDDRRVARRLQTQFAAAGIDATVVDDAASPVAVQSVYAAMDLVVATRMHAAIFALTCGTPVIALGYQPKSCGLMGMIGLGDACLPLEQVTAADLVNRATRILADPAPIRAHIAAAMQEVRAKIAAWSPERDLRG